MADDPFRIELGDYAAGSLDEGRRTTVARHVERCPACAAWLATWRDAARAFAEPLSTPHPPAEALARYLFAPEELAAAEWRALGEHLSECAACGREAELLRAADADAQASPAATTAAPSRRAVWALAASLTLAVVGAAWLESERRALRRELDASSDRPLAAVWVGPAERAAGSEALRVEAGGPVVHLAVALDPEEIARHGPGGELRFRLADGGAERWRAAAPAGDWRRPLEETGFLLLRVPRSALGAGAVTLTVELVSGEQSPRLLLQRDLAAR